MLHWFWYHPPHLIHTNTLLCNPKYLQASPCSYHTCIPLGFISKCTWHLASLLLTKYIVLASYFPLILHQPVSELLGLSCTISLQCPLLSDRTLLYLQIWFAVNCHVKPFTSLLCCNILFLHIFFSPCNFLIYVQLKDLSLISMSSFSFLCVSLALTSMSLITNLCWEAHTSLKGKKNLICTTSCLFCFLCIHSSGSWLGGRPAFCF